MEKGRKLPEPTNFNLFSADAKQLAGLRHLPRTFDEAMEEAKVSQFVNRVLPEQLLELYAVKNIHNA